MVFGAFFSSDCKVGDTQDTKSVFAGLKIGLSLHARGFGVLKISLGNGSVTEEILRTDVELVGENKCSVSFQVRGAGRRVVWAIDCEKRLANVDVFAGCEREFHERDHRWRRRPAWS